ncbi:LysR family transcriptional regulator, nitrogen assimilation regulatory protein [Marinomonas polaris DSM 16579]|uniref:LysR family transcriptional regulator, nitrogen assimilation regulatory protein n=1 Tax=Marinomonas polaris DSM 16579 TaxID=1122206 RepID=A0A1M4VBK4_9GAMM|nr:LysR family transcriptional regulator [Marinomonas polaris]SHE66307.1 LysR family transcriptional regulator, nitrogen assimilation regulatory protein [Marinomonas polaris DSM 16579]
MNSKQLTFFLKTAELNSIAAAARALDVAQPSISLQLENLEHELGTNLFDRSFRGVVLTQSGQIFLAHAESIMRQMEQAKCDVHQFEHEPSGVLSIGMTQPIGNIISVPLLALVEQRYPKITLDLHAGLSYNLSNQLQSGEIDIAISSPDGSDMSQIRQIKLFREKLFLAVGCDSKVASYKKLSGAKTITFSELAHHEVIVTGPRDSLGYVLSQYEEKTGIRLPHKAAFGQLMTTLRYVVDGHGVLLSPTSAFYHLQQANQIQAIEIVEPTLWRDVCVSTAADRPQTALLNAVIPLIKEVTKAEWESGRWQGELLAS